MDVVNVSHLPTDNCNRHMFFAYDTCVVKLLG